jgi:hypothetical protein
MRTIMAKFDSWCPVCRQKVLGGTEVRYDDAARKAYHMKCAPAEQQDLLPSADSEKLADELGFK